MLGVLLFLVTSIFLHLSFTRYLCLLLGLCGAATAIYTPIAEPAGESAAAVFAPLDARLSYLVMKPNSRASESRISSRDSRNH